MDPDKNAGLPLSLYGKDDGITKNLFNESLSGGYHFKIKDDIGWEGSRSLYFYKAERTLLISHFISSRVHVLDLETGKLRWFDHHKATVRNVSVCDREIISSSWDGTVCVTDFDSLKLLRFFTEDSMGRCPYTIVSPDKDFIYSYSYDSDKNPDLNSNAVRKWNLADGKLVKRYELPGEHMDARRSGRSAVYDNRLFIVSDTGNLHIYDCITGRLLVEDFYDDPLWSICMFPHLDLLIIAGGKGNIYLSDLSGRRIRFKTKAHEFNISQLLVHPDKTDLMISISFDGTTKVWRLPDLEPISTIDNNEVWLWSVVAHDDLLIIGGENIETTVYEIKNLSKPELKGRLFLNDESYVFISDKPDTFYTNNISIVRVVKNNDGTPMEGLLAEYLLNTSCNLETLRDLFSSKENKSSRPIFRDKGLLQITQ